jgi:hypothetical protein
MCEFSRNRSISVSERRHVTVKLIFVYAVMYLDNWLDDSGFESGQGKEILSFSKMSLSVLRLMQPSLQRLAWSLPADGGGEDYVTGG